MYIIINADDFGASKKINEAIICCHDNGILSSTSLIAKGKAFGHAIDLLCNHRQLGVGVHLALDGDYNFTTTPNSIINKDTGKFFNGKELLKRIRTFRLIKNDLIREYSRQIEYILDHNVKISHIDHHHHFHLYKNVLDAVIDVARKYKIGYVRSQRMISSNRQFLPKYYYRLIHQRYLKFRYQTIDGYFGFQSRDLRVMKKELIQLLKQHFAIVEIVVHPAGLSDPETVLLTRDDTRQLLVDHRIITYANLMS